MRLNKLSLGLFAGLLASTAMMSGALALDTARLAPRDAKFSFEGAVRAL